MGKFIGLLALLVVKSFGVWLNALLAAALRLGALD